MEFQVCISIWDERALRGRQCHSDRRRTDRRFFARTGEILYLMLCRSRRAAELRECLETRILKADAPYDGLIEALQGDVQFAWQERAGAYLPCASHPTFDRLAEDWIAILDLQIPAYDAIPHIVTMAGPHLVLYQLQRSAEVLAQASPISMVCEIVSPKRPVVRNLSADSFQGNTGILRIAGALVEHYGSATGP